MEFVRVLRWAAMLVAAIVVVAGLLVAGAYGAFGPEVALVVSGTYQNIDDFLAANERRVDRFWKVLGAAGTVGSLCFGIFKAWSAADINFPIRLHAFLKRNDERLEKAIPALVHFMTTNKGDRIDAPVCLVGPLNEALRRLQFGKVGAASADLARAIRAAERQIEASTAQHKRLRTELAAAHLLKGVAIAAIAGMEGKDRGREQELDADKHFAAALEINPDDKLALYFRGLHLLRLGQAESALEDFSAIDKKTVNQIDDLVSKARYEAAQICFRKNEPNLSLANSFMIRAIASASTGAKTTTEYAQMNLLHGRIRELQGYLGVAAASYREAERALQSLKGSGVEELNKTVKNALVRVG